MKFIFSFFIFAVVAFPNFAHANCESQDLNFAGGKYVAHLTWDQGPDKEGGESRMRVEWRESATKTPVDPGAFTVELWMPAMGHGSAPTQIQRVLNEKGDVATGVYQVLNMYFIMPGAWDVRVSLKGSNGSSEMQTWPVTIAGESHGGHHH